MKKRFLKWYDHVFSAMMVILGFSSCDKVIDSPAEYGSPNMEYQLKGTVTDEESGKPIRGIQARRVWIGVEEGRAVVHPVDSVTTDDAGVFVFPLEHAPAYMGSDYGENMALVTEDVDGEDNGGHYESDTVMVNKLEMKKVGEGDGKWYKGRYEIRADRKLRKKK